ncbi:MAG: hypothetical protein AAF202_07700, partial [Pseudomonadota bacterium]
GGGDCHINHAGYAVRITMEKFDNQLVKKEYLYTTRDCRRGTVGGLMTSNYWIRDTQLAPDNSTGEEYSLSVSPQWQTIETFNEPVVFNENGEKNTAFITYHVCPGGSSRHIERPNTSRRVVCPDEADQIYNIAITEFEEEIFLPRVSRRNNVFLPKVGDPRGTSAHQHETTTGAGDPAAREVF